jgi:hypothetical protein
MVAFCNQLITQGCENGVASNLSCSEGKDESPDRDLAHVGTTHDPDASCPARVRHYLLPHSNDPKSRYGSSGLWIDAVASARVTTPTYWSG